MARAIGDYGTATLSYTLGSGGVTPSVTLTVTMSNTSTSKALVSVVSGIRDVLGDIQISGTLSGSTSLIVSASRQLPAGKEIVFNWAVLEGTA